MRFAKSLNIAFVAMATPEQATEFLQGYRMPHPMICDPDKELYGHFGLGRGTPGQMFGPRMFLRGFGAVLRGHWVGMPIGDPWQMPGIFVIQPGGEVSWEYRSSDAADNLSLDELSRAVDEG